MISSSISALPVTYKHKQGPKLVKDLTYTNRYDSIQNELMWFNFSAYLIATWHKILEKLHSLTDLFPPDLFTSINLVQFAFFRNQSNCYIFFGHNQIDIWEYALFKIFFSGKNITDKVQYLTVKYNQKEKSMEILRLDWSVILTLSARLWLSVAWPLLALTWM